MAHQTILVLDFGSQFTQLIARRLRELSVYSEILPFNTPLETLRARKPVGLILSGGPKSVSEDDAPHCDPRVLELGVPTLGICYGMQLMTHMLGGSVSSAPHREFGHAVVRVRAGDAPRLFRELPVRLRVWASHGDFVAAAPQGFAVVATSANAPVAAMEAPERGYYALLFHPEVAHTERGKEILRNFAYDVCGCTGDWTIASFIDESIGPHSRASGRGDVSSARFRAASTQRSPRRLIHRAIGDRLQCIFVDNGLLRMTKRHRWSSATRSCTCLSHFVDASDVFLTRLAGVIDPEQKRKIIGGTFIDVFEEEARKLGQFDFWHKARSTRTSSSRSRCAGRRRSSRATTTSADCRSGCGSSWSSRCASCSRTKCGRSVATLASTVSSWSGSRSLGPGWRYDCSAPSPASGSTLLRRADAIVAEEMRRSGWYERLWQSFAVLLPVQSVGVMGDARTYEYTVAIRAVESLDGMTADWARLPHDLLATISSASSTKSAVSTASCTTSRRSRRARSSGNEPGHTVVRASAATDDGAGWLGEPPSPGVQDLFEGSRIAIALSLEGSGVGCKLGDFSAQSDDLSGGGVQLVANRDLARLRGEDCDFAADRSQPLVAADRRA